MFCIKLSSGLGYSDIALIKMRQRTTLVIWGPTCIHAYTNLQKDILYPAMENHKKHTRWHYPAIRIVMVVGPSLACGSVALLLMPTPQRT
jgi:hypothetical protein